MELDFYAGAPQESPIFRQAHKWLQQIRVKTWFNAVTKASGKRAAALEREFWEVKRIKIWDSDLGRRAMFPKKSQDEDGRLDSAKAPSCTWQKYKQGLVAPRRGTRPDGSLALVDRVEQRYPGTAKWLDSPIWRLCEYMPLDMGELRNIFDEMIPRVRSYFLRSPNKSTDIFWRRPANREALCKTLMTFATTDDFIAVLALIKEAEAIQDQRAHKYWVQVAKRWMATRDERILGSSRLLPELEAYLQLSWSRASYLEGVTDR
ncbi:MAG: hypothetical protein WCV99_18085 [Sterolibacterium sp.]